MAAKRAMSMSQYGGPPGASQTKENGRPRPFGGLIFFFFLALLTYFFLIVLVDFRGNFLPNGIGESQEDIERVLDLFLKC